MNDTSEHTKKKNSELEKNEYWVQSRDIALNVLQTAFRNNKFLLQKQGKTEKDQFNELQSHKIKLTPTSMYNYREKRNKFSTSLMPIAILCKYWELPMSELISHHYENYEELK